MELFLRLKPQGNENHGTRVIKQISDTEIALVNSADLKTSFEFGRVFNEETTQAQIFEKVIEKKLVDTLFNKEDCVAFTFGPAGSGSSYTMLGGKDTLNLDGLIARSLNLIFDRIGEENIASYKTMKKFFGPSLNGAETSDTSTNGSFGITLSMFELKGPQIKDLLTNKTASCRPSSLTRDLKDGKIRPNGVTHTHLASYEQGLSTLRKGWSKRGKSAERGNWVVQFNLYECVKINKWQLSRLTLIGLSNSDETSSKDISSFLKQIDQPQSGSLRTSIYNKLMFSDMMLKGKFNITGILTMDSYGEEGEILKILSLFFDEINVRKRSRVVTPTRELVSQFEKMKLEMLEIKNRNLLLEADNEKLNGDLLHLEHDIRVELSNHYEQIINEINHQNVTSKFENDESYQQDTDAKLDSLSEHFNFKIKAMSDENAALKLQLENMRYQNERMDKLFHEEVSKLKEEERSVEREEKSRLVDKNDMLEQKIQILESQLSSLKEKSSHNSEEANQLFSKIKSLRLEEEVMKLIGEKKQAQLGKSKRLSQGRSRSKSPLVSLNSISGKDFKIFEDTAPDKRLGHKRKLSRREAFDAENSDVEMEHVY